MRISFLQFLFLLILLFILFTKQSQLFNKILVNLISFLQSIKKHNSLKK